MRFSLLAFLFLFCLSLQAQGTPKTLLWRIQGPAPMRPSYLTGTIHTRDARAFRHLSAVLAVMDSCDAVAGELRMDQLAELKELKATRLFLPAGTELEDLLPKRRAKRVRAALKERFGPMSGMFVRLRPFYLTAAWQEMAQQQDSTSVLDQYLQDVAEQRGLATLGLETVDEQLGAVAEVPLKEQAEMLYETIREDPKAAWERTMAFYVAQDLDGLMQLFSENGASSDVAEERLLNARNAVMAQRMDSLMRDGRTFLFAVGAAHLPTTEGVIAKLRELGYAVVPMSTAVPER